jgi:hypothetical protein
VSYLVILCQYSKVVLFCVREVLKFSEENLNMSGFRFNVVAVAAVMLVSGSVGMAIGPSTTIERRTQIPVPVPFCSQGNRIVLEQFDSSPQGENEVVAYQDTEMSAELPLPIREPEEERIMKQCRDGLLGTRVFHGDSPSQLVVLIDRKVPLMEGEYNQIGTPDRQYIIQTDQDVGSPGRVIRLWGDPFEGLTPITDPDTRDLAFKAYLNSRYGNHLRDPFSECIQDVLEGSVATSQSSSRSASLGANLLTAVSKSAAAATGDVTNVVVKAAVEGTEKKEREHGDLLRQRGGNLTYSHFRIRSFAPDSKPDPHFNDHTIPRGISGYDPLATQDTLTLLFPCFVPPAQLNLYIQALHEAERVYERRGVTGRDRVEAMELLKLQCPSIRAELCAEEPDELCKVYDNLVQEGP